MRKVPLYCSLISLLSGCQTFTGFPGPPRDIIYANGSAKDLATAEADALKRYHGTDVDRLSMTPAEYRDSFVNSELKAIDGAFNDFCQNLRSHRATFNIVTSATLLTLNGLAATTGGAETKAALAAASAGIIGQKGAVDQELFNAETMAALIARMKAARLAALVPIKAGLNQDARAYSLEAALVDLEAYRESGNLLSTLDSISTDAGKSTAQSLSEITRDRAFHDSRKTAATLEQRLANLTDPQTLALILRMEMHMSERSAALQNDLHAQNPSNSRLTNPVAARAFLNAWLEQDDGTPAQMQQWGDQLTAVEGN